MSEEPAKQPEHVVELSGVTKRYAFGESHVEVLRGVDLALSRGGSCAIMGPSGVGKSTLLACVAGLVVPDGGEARVLGEDVAKLDDRGRTVLRRRMGIVYQFFHLVPNLTVRENVALPHRRARGGRRGGDDGAGRAHEAERAPAFAAPGGRGRGDRAAGSAGAGARG
ncbi:MAG: ATP-binding cassette domain-containing protein [Polyangiaceae bacterium]